MKRVLGLALVGGFAAAFAVAGFPASAADSSVAAVGASSWNPNPVNIDPGDTVTWSNSTGFNHNVCVSKPGSPQGTCDEYLNPATPKADWSADAPVAHQFTTAGSYAYRCQLHTGMQGTVNVGVTPTTTSTTTTSTTTGTTTTTDTTTTTPTNTTITSTSPTLTIEPSPPMFVGAIKRRSSRRVLKLTFKVSRDAKLTATLRRRPPGKKSFSFVSKTTKAVTAGSNTVSLLRAGRRLRAGAYKLTLVLKDSEGQSPGPKVLNFKLT